MSLPKERVDHRLDLTGKVCPYPTLDTTSVIKKMAPGEVLMVITDYYPARQTIPGLMEDLGYPCELIDGEKPVFHFLIHKTERPRTK